MTKNVFANSVDLISILWGSQLSFFMVEEYNVPLLTNITLFFELTEI